jgi:hypothetical protein
MTLIGLYNLDSDFFETLTLPEDYDKTTFINTLLLEHGEKCILYTNPDFMKMAISIWSDKWALELQRIYDALTAEYNPIWNYDRNEKITETDKPDNTVTRTHNNTDTQTNRYDIVNEQNVDAKSENEISADNSSNYQPENKNTSNFGKNTTSNDGTITDAHTGTITDVEKGTRSNIDRTGHIWGNIGVTTSTQMIESETLIRAKRNLYDIATRLFANELLIGIY